MLGRCCFGETLSLMRAAGLLAIIVGIALIQLE
jgi:multidrug transporter EmrE-like cation transporter